MLIIKNTENNIICTTQESDILLSLGEIICKFSL